MFGTAGKSSRGGHGGAGKGKKRKLNSNFRSASFTRPSGGRPSVESSRNNRTTTATPAAVTTATAPAEETYSLVTGNPLDFAMIIRLTPDLVDEIKRAESQGGSARIKFDAIANNSSGNVIDVGGKDFRFTWSREMGDLCDIYEERQSGEDGNGLLVESGGAWRKLNVQRVLDESTKNHVKMRSEEAERKSKSRKVTILDHGSSSMKSQMKALAAAEATPWKMSSKQQKEPPYKKSKAEPPPGPKSAQKHVLSSKNSKGRTSSSTLPSPHEQPHGSASLFGTKSVTRGYACLEDNMSIQTSKEKPSSSEKGTPGRIITNAVVDKLASKGSVGIKPTDLKSMLIFLLTQNPRGMSLKALENSVGQNFPDAGRQIKAIIKKIATYKPPGRYILKSEAELESLQKPVYQSGSSPENNQQQTSGPVDKCDGNGLHDPESNATVKTHTQNDEAANLNSVPGEVSTDAEKINIPLQSPDHYAEKNVPDYSEGLVATSSNSGSVNDSDSSDCGSDSGSHSRSRSKSKSPVGSGSGSSSDSESDASSNSKEGSDEEVDIMTSDDDKDLKDNLQASEPELSTSPILWKPDGLSVQNATDEKEDLHASEVIEITEKSRSYAQVAEFDAYNGSVSNDKEGEDSQVIKPCESSPSSDDCAMPQKTEVYRGDSNRERDGFRHEQSDRYQRKPEVKSKKRSAEKHFDDNNVCSKKVKTGSMTKAPIQIEDGYNNEKRPPKNPRDGAVDINLTHSDSHQRKQGELPGKIQKVGSVSKSHMDVVYPSKDNISEIDRLPIINGRGLNLRREPLELEQGELRDPLPEETPGIEKQSDKKGSIKPSENKLTSFDYRNPDISKGKSAGRTSVDPVKPSSADFSDICKDPPILDSRAGGKTNRGTFLNNNNSIYCKYEKDKPELKGPIKDHSQYMECMKEFQEKYESYLSIKKILESERNEFLKFGRDLEAAKEKDMIKYSSILEELKESYRRCGTRHKRLKKVYIVLYRELETLKKVIKDYANQCPKA